MKSRTWIICVAIAAITAPPAHAQVKYAITDLTSLWRAAVPAPENVVYFEATSVNDIGQITGIYYTRDSQQYGFVWDRLGGFEDVGDLGLPGFTYANAINNRGQVVGESTVDSVSREQHAFLWDRDHGMRDLGTLGGGLSYASDINDQGQVVGASWPGDEFSHAFLWTAADGMIDLGTLGGTYSKSVAINNAGDAVGLADNADASCRSFLWDPIRGMRDLGPLETIRATDLNDLKQVLGMGGDALTNVILSENDVTRDLGTFADGTTWAFAINDQTQIVGAAWATMPDCSFVQHAFLWTEDAGMRDLNDLVPNDAPWLLNEARDINTSGSIVSNGRDAEGNRVSLLLAPVPEPAVAIICFPLFAMAAVCWGTTMRNYGWRIDEFRGRLLRERLPSERGKRC